MEIEKRKRGVDEVLKFFDILVLMVNRVEPNKNYRDSGFRKTLRL